MVHGRLSPEERRKQILVAARTLISQAGVESVRVEDILQQLSLSKGGFYHHFRSLDEVLRELNYGCVAVNAFAALAYGHPAPRLAEKDRHGGDVSSRHHVRARRKEEEEIGQIGKSPGTLFRHSHAPR